MMPEQHDPIPTDSAAPYLPVIAELRPSRRQPILANDESSAVGDVASFPVGHYPKNQIVGAGEALGKEIIWDEAKRGEIFHIFRIARDWRDSNAYLMRKI